MADEQKFPPKLEFFFEIAKDHRTIACNGAWGGITPRGDIHIDFFIEKQAVPESVVNPVGEDGKLGPITETKPPKRFVRELQVGILITQTEAENLVKFLNERLKQLEEIRGKLEDIKGKP